MNIEHLGQVWTPDDTVDKILELRQFQGSLLEPSAGNGAFWHRLCDGMGNVKDGVGIEIDPVFVPLGCKCMDFFDFGMDNKFKTIVGNPPYVAYKKIYEGTKKKLPIEIFDEKSNLYLFFIFKCLSHLKPGGEIIFITPRDFIKATSARRLNEIMYRDGTLTHFYETGDEIVFPGVAPNCAIWRYELGNMTHVTKTNDGLKNQVLIDGQICFTASEYTVPFNDLFFVHVGAVSGADKIFTHPDGNYEFVCSSTKKTGKLKKMFYNVINDHLVAHKDKLLARKVIPFNEGNWWKWGREIFESDLPRVYVNSKTRQENPFFRHDCDHYDGSILGIFIRGKLTEDEVVHLLNQVDWAELGFKVGGRFVFSQRALENIMLPTNLFGKYLERIKNEEE